ncbi:hypothetical protein EVAR_66632_1 [Eumeta japonica]|uniref:Uncharacterized protein n=1 Tax=Eumeta variegata TaxID=151549 RepID=A0A4C1ZTX2_EUMVA|nr:hypothetical protein EVAR_66632_1 [Eumeta japonica]
MYTGMPGKSRCAAAARAVQKTTRVTRMFELQQQTACSVQPCFSMNTHCATSPFRRDASVSMEGPPCRPLPDTTQWVLLRELGFSRNYWDDRNDCSRIMISSLYLNA